MREKGRTADVLPSGIEMGNSTGSLQHPPVGMTTARESLLAYLASIQTAQRFRVARSQLYHMLRNTLYIYICYKCQNKIYKMVQNLYN